MAALQQSEVKKWQEITIKMAACTMMTVCAGHITLNQGKVAGVSDRQESMKHLHPICVNLQPVLC